MLSKLLSAMRVPLSRCAAGAAVLYHEGYSAYQSLPPNLLGRDFIVPDLHGSYALLMEHLHEARFDPSRDRLILTGDLIDRGPSSFECLMLLMQPWVYAVMGNHEWMLLTWMALRDSDYHEPADFIRNGGDWVFWLSAEQQQILQDTIIPKLLTLPLVLTVQDARCPYHVAHGELVGRGRLPDSMKDMDAPLLQDADLTEATVRALGTHIVWSRRLVRKANQARLDMFTRGMAFDVEGVQLTAAPLAAGLSLTYVGHNIVPRAVMHQSHVYLDRGAYEDSPDSELFVLEHGRFVTGLQELGVLP